MQKKTEYSQPYNQTILPDSGYDGLSSIFLYGYQGTLSFYTYVVKSETLSINTSISSTAGNISGKINWN